jgi:hypothetical protein
VRRGRRGVHGAHGRHQPEPGHVCAAPVTDLVGGMSGGGIDREKRSSA